MSVNKHMYNYMQSMLITLLMLLISLSHLCCCDSCTATDVVTDAVAVVVVVGKDCCRGALVGAVVVGFAYRMIYQWTHTNARVRVHTRTHKHSLLIEVIL